VRQLKPVLTASVVVALAATAWSQQPPRPTQTPPPAAPRAEGESSELVLKTQFLEAHKAKKWDVAVETFQKLRTNFAPAVSKDKRLLYLYAEAQYNHNDLGPAATTLEGLLELQDNHVRALFLLAKIKAQSKEKDAQAQDHERAKDLLIQAARAGLYVLRDISSADGKKVFGFLLNDPQFILRVMNAANEYQIHSPSEIHNPFASPLIKAKNEDQQGDIVQTGPVPDQRQAELEGRIEDLFKEIVKLAEDRQVEELITKVTELRQIMNEFGAAGTAEVKKKLEKWNQRLSDLGEIVLSIRLQVYISEGNQHLRAMADAIRTDQYDQAIDHFNQIEALCEQMKAEDRDVFHRNAEALYLRGKALADRARRLKKISEFKLVVTGVVVAPPDGKEPDRAIINDHIYTEGDQVIDPATDEEIQGLRVVEIIRSTVRFRYEDTEFVRELKPQQ
jgi:hypothetical protein